MTIRKCFYIFSLIIVWSPIVFDFIKNKKVGLTKKDLMDWKFWINTYIALFMPQMFVMLTCVALILDPNGTWNDLKKLYCN